MRRNIFLCATAGLVLGLGAYTQLSAAQAPAASASPFRLTATIQDIMQNEVDPSADFLWAAVGTTYTKGGAVEKQPRTDAEWAELRRHAIILVEATNLLIMEGRRVVAPGKQIEDASLPGVSTPAQIEAKINANRAAFITYAAALHDTANDALRAIDARNLEALAASGEHIDAACEGCHRAYWYPNTDEPINSRGVALPKG